MHWTPHDQYHDVGKYNSPTLDYPAKASNHLPVILPPVYDEESTCNQIKRSKLKGEIKTSVLPLPIQASKCTGKQQKGHVQQYSI